MANSTAAVHDWMILIQTRSLIVSSNPKLGAEEKKAAGLSSAVSPQGRRPDDLQVIRWIAKAASMARQAVGLPETL